MSCVMKRTIKRAVRSEESIVAECPIRCTCGYWNAELEKWRFCGWFGGAAGDEISGVTITCRYQKNREEMKHA